MMNDGHIEDQGTFADIQQTHSVKLRRMSSEHAERFMKKNEEDDDNDISCDHNDGEVSEQMEHRKETQSVGSVSWDVYKAYFKSINCWPLMIIVAILLIAAQVATSAIDLFVARWTNWETEMGKVATSVSNKRSADFIAPEIDIDGERLKYAYIYSGLMVIVLYLVFQRASAFFCMCLRASRIVHDKLFYGVIRAKMYFFATNSSGRVINRFSKDIYDIDTHVAYSLYDSILVSLEAKQKIFDKAQNLFIKCSNSFSCNSLLSWFWFRSRTIIFCCRRFWWAQPSTDCDIFTWRQRVVLSASNQWVSQRTEKKNFRRIFMVILMLGRSPMYAHTNSTVSGLSTIRVWKAQSLVAMEFNTLQDANTSAFFIFCASSRALALWLEAVCVIYLASTITIFLLLGKGRNHGIHSKFLQFNLTYIYEQMRLAEALDSQSHKSSTWLWWANGEWDKQPNWKTLWLRWNEWLNMLT